MRNIIMNTCILFLLVSQFSVVFALPTRCSGGIMGKGGCGQMPPSWAKKGDSPMTGATNEENISLENKEEVIMPSEDLSVEIQNKTTMVKKGIEMTRPDKNSIKVAELRKVLNESKRYDKLITKFKTNIKSSLSKKNKMGFIHIEYPSRDKKYNTTYIAFQDPKSNQFYFVMKKAGSKSIEIRLSEVKKMKESAYVVHVWHTNQQTKERSEDLIGYLTF